MVESQKTLAHGSVESKPNYLKTYFEISFLALGSLRKMFFFSGQLLKLRQEKNSNKKQPKIGAELQEKGH